MTTFKASCPVCGEIELTPSDIKLMVCNHAPRSFYSFHCDKCNEEVCKPADDQVVSLLVSGSVPAQVWDLPAEAFEIKVGPPISYDDLLDFALALESDNESHALHTELHFTV
jgi:hypothetical protein